MKISESTYQRMPDELKQLFEKLPNPHSEQVRQCFPNSKDGTAHGRNASAGNVYGNGKGLISQDKGNEKIGYGGAGSNARYFKQINWNPKDEQEE